MKLASILSFSLPALALAAGLEHSHEQRDAARLLIHRRQGLLDGIFGPRPSSSASSSDPAPTPAPGAANPALDPDQAATQTTRDVFGGTSAPPLFGNDGVSASSVSNVVTTGLVLPSGVPAPAIPPPINATSISSSIPGQNGTIPTASASGNITSVARNATASSTSAVKTSKTKKQDDAVETKVVVVGADQSNPTRMSGNNAELSGGAERAGPMSIGMGMMLVASGLAILII